MANVTTTQLYARVANQETPGWGQTWEGFFMVGETGPHCPGSAPPRSPAGPTLR